MEETIKQLKKQGGSSDISENKKKDIEKKKLELEKLESARKKSYMTKSELKNTRERLQDKNSLFQTYTNESDFLLKQIESISITLFDKRSSHDKLNNLKHRFSEKKDSFNAITRREAELEKTN